jgi:cellulose/xylan binding protein with CBM9 domain
MRKILAALLLCVSCSVAAEGPASYTIYRAESPISIDAKVNDPAWRHAPLLSDFHFNWWTSGEKERTEARMLWDEISASVTQRHGPVSNDDCVEIFISPDPNQVMNYYTFEINAIGTMLNRCRTSWWKGPPTWNPEGVRYRTSLDGMRVKHESPSDSEWSVELAIPFENFSHDAAHVPPHDGDVWRMNLYRTGGITNKQDSSWSPIPTGASHSFHQPEYFGTVRFSTSTAGK